MTEGEAEGIFMAREAVSRSFLYAYFPEPWALAARASIALIFERDGGEVRRRAEVFDDPVRVGVDVIAPVVVFTEAGGGRRSVAACADPVTILTVIDGQGTGEREAEVGRGKPLFQARMGTLLPSG